MNNLFLNTFADVKCITLGVAKQRIIKMVWDVCIKRFKSCGYTANELKEAYDNLCNCNMQNVYDNGVIEIEGHEYNFYKLIIK